MNQTNQKQDMVRQHRAQRLRVETPTLEPDPVFLRMLADLSTSSRTAGPRTARSAGLRMIVATASVAVVATATWAGGIGMGTPLSPANAPSQQEPSGPPSHGDVATPQGDVSFSPGSPVSPGLPGTTPLVPNRDSGGVGSHPQNGQAKGKPGSKPATPKNKGKKPGTRNGKARRGAADESRRVTRPRQAPVSTPRPITPSRK